MHKINRREKGQSLITFVAAFPILIFALTVAFDFGRLLILKSQARLLADSSALAAAGALDMQSLDDGVFILNSRWANARAYDAVSKSISHLPPEDSWMHLRLTNVSVRGAQVTVSVVGTCDFVWGTYLGLANCSTTAVSSARAASGISSERIP